MADPPELKFKKSRHRSRVAATWKLGQCISPGQCAQFKSPV